MTGELRRKTLESIGLNAASKVVGMAFQALSNVILSRRLSSTDYGVVGFAWVFITFLSQFSDVGIESAAVQKHQLDRVALATGFVLKVLLGASLFLVAAFGAPAALFFFDNPAVVGVIRLLALNFLINSLAFVPSTLLRRALDYRKLALGTTVGTVVTSTAAIVLALTGFGYQSIVFSSLAGSVASTVALNVIRAEKIPLRVHWGYARDFIRYGSGLFIASLMVFAIFNADSLIIGAVKGSTNLGYYTLAFTWGSTVTTLMGAIVNNVLFPTMSQMQNDRERLARAYLTSLKYVSLLGILVNVTLVVTAEAFLFHVLGHGTDKWRPALGALQILAIYGMIRVVLEPLGSVLMAVGRTNLLLGANVLAASIELLALYPALLFFDLEGVAIVVTVAYATQYLIYYPFVTKDLGISWRELLGAISPAILSAVVVGLCIHLLGYVVAGPDTITIFMSKILMCVVIYLIAYGSFTGRNVISEVRDVLS
jgi:PST family polysaccharide transporter/lipopolysaccharide exporter